MTVKGLGGLNANGTMPLWMKFVSAVGVPSALAIYLVWFLANNVLGAITTHSQDHERPRDGCAHVSDAAGLREHRGHIRGTRGLFSGDTLKRTTWLFQTGAPTSRRFGTGLGSRY